MHGKVIEEVFRGAIDAIGTLVYIAFAGVLAILAWIGYGIYLWLN